MKTYYIPNIKDSNNKNVRKGFCSRVQQDSYGKLGHPFSMNLITFALGNLIQIHLGNNSGYMRQNINYLPSWYKADEPSLVFIDNALSTTTETNTGKILYCNVTIIICKITATKRFL